MHRLVILFVCCLVIFTDMVGYSIITPSIPLFAQLFNASDAEMGYAFAAYPVAFLITIIPFGFLVDKLGENHLIIGVGMCSLAMACLMLIFSHSIVTFSLARAFQGIGSAASWVAAQPLAAQNIESSTEKGLEVSALTLAFGLGMILGPLIGSIGTLRTPFYLNFFLALIIGMVALIVLRGETLREKVCTYNYFSIITRPPIIVACTTIMLLYASVGMMEVLFPLYMDSLRYMKRSIGMLFFVLSVFLVLSQPFIGYWIQRVNPSVPIISGFVLIAGALSLMVVGTSFACWIPVFIVFGVAMGILVSVSMLLIALHSRPSEQGAAYGIWNFSFSVGYLVGPVLGGTLSDLFHVHMPQIGIRAPFFLFSIIMVLCVIFFKVFVLRASPELS